MARSSARPGRAVTVFFIGLAIAYGLVALSGTWKPALGLDLQGGTQITLTAKGDRRRIVTDDTAGLFAAARGDVLTAPSDARIAGTRYTDWLSGAKRVERFVIDQDAAFGVLERENDASAQTPPGRTEIGERLRRNRTLGLHPPKRPSHLANFRQRLMQEPLIIEEALPAEDALLVVAPLQAEGLA